MNSEKMNNTIDKILKKYPDVPVIIATAVTAETGMIFGLDTEESK